MIHRIRRAVFELWLADEATALRGRTRMQAVLDRAVLPVLQEAFDAAAPADQLRSFERLEIDLGRIDLDRLDEEALRQIIRGQVARWLNAPSASREPELAAPSVERTLAAFLETGAWPWQAIVRSTQELEAALFALPAVEARELARRLVPLLRRRVVRRRIGYQFSAAFVRWLVEQLEPQRAEEILRLASAMLVDLNASSATAVVLAAVAIDLVAEAGEPARVLSRRKSEEQRLSLAEWHDERVPEDTTTERSDDEAPRRTSLAVGERSAETEPLYVGCAGVVLLHPFLERFFREVGLVTNGTLLTSAAHRTRAVHLLYHLATGGERPDEHQTTLLKLLAGLPVSYPMSRDLALHQEERAEAENLLVAAVNHWPALKSTSPAGLREGFLQREGRLVERPDGWKLVVEQRPVDVLLSSLPWGLSVVRLPWMSAPLWVDWA